MDALKATVYVKIYCPTCEKKVKIKVPFDRVRFVPIYSGWSDVDDGKKFWADCTCPECQKHFRDVVLYEEPPY